MAVASLKRLSPSIMTCNCTGAPAAQAPHHNNQPGILHQVCLTHSTLIALPAQRSSIGTTTHCAVDLVHSCCLDEARRNSMIHVQNSHCHDVVTALRIMPTATVQRHRGMS